MVREGEVPSAVNEGRPYYGTTALLVIPNSQATTQSTFAPSSNTLYYEPMILRNPVTITAVTIEVTVAKTGKDVRVGIYEADKNWQPGKLISDIGALSVNDVAVVSINSLSIKLKEGRYLIALHSQDNPTLRAIRCGMAFSPSTLGASAVLTNLYVAKTYAVLADPGTAWTNISAGTLPFYHTVFLSITP